MEYGYLAIGMRIACILQVKHSGSGNSVVTPGCVGKLEAEDSEASRSVQALGMR